MILLIAVVIACVLIAVSSLRGVDGICAAPTLSRQDSIESVTTYDYYYSGIARFDLVPFSVSPSSCEVTYACLAISGPEGINMCNYSDSNLRALTFESGKDHSLFTRSLFNSDTLTFSFESNDIKAFGNQTITFQITGQAGESNESTELSTFQLNLLDPCLISEIIIDSDIIDKSIKYNVH